MSDTSKWLSQNSGSSHPAVAFETIGAMVIGKIVEEPRIVTTNDLNTGKPVDSLVITIEALAGCTARCGKADMREAIGAGDTVSIWVKPGALARAIDTAIKAKNAVGLAEGGTLALQYTGNGERKKAGFNAPKLYAAEYNPPQPTVSVQGLIPPANALT